MKRRTGAASKILGYGITVTIVGLFAVAGLKVLGISLAATSTNPYGQADYCTLEGTSTVVYGWAYDANATVLTQPAVSVRVGSQVKTANSDRAGYRDPAVNKVIKGRNAEDPTPGTYGFRIVYTGLYKGTSYAISGTIINVGAGANAAMIINTNPAVNGGNAVFGGGIIPDACLQSRPAPPAPPTPAPAPTPLPSPTPPRAAPAPRPAVPAAPVVADPSAETNAVITAGSMAAEFKVPAGDAAKVLVRYGKNAAVLDQTTPELPTNGGDTTHRIIELQPRTAYSYQLVRTNSAGKTVSSPTATFQTLGFTLSMLFTNSKSKGVPGIEARINEQKLKATSDKNGTISFRDLPAGKHIVTFKYSGKSYDRTLLATTTGINSDAISALTPLTVRETVNLDKLAVASTKQPAPSGIPQYIWYAAGGTLIAGILVILTVRRNKKSGAYVYDEVYDMAPPTSSVADTPAEQMPVYQPVPDQPPAPIPAAPTAVAPGSTNSSFDKSDRASDDNDYTDLPPGPQTTPETQHAGESLKSMVLRSMAEEARRRENNTRSNTPDGPDTPRRPSE